MRLAHHRRAGAAPRRGERAETLIELVATIVLIGVGMLAILSSLVTSSVSAATARERTRVSLILNKWAEMNTAPKTASGGNGYIPCSALLPSAGFLEATGGGAPYNTWTASFTDEYISSDNPADWANPTWVSQSACNSAGDKGLQRLTLTITTTSGRGQITDTIVVVKRNNACPTQFNNADQGPC